MRGFILAALLQVAVAGALHASVLAGNTIQTSYEFPNIGTNYAGPVNSVVGAGLELTNFAGFVNIDFSDTNITVTTIRNAGINAVAFDGLHFFDVFGAIPSFTSVTLNAATNYGGLTSSNISFDANNIYVNVANLPGLSGQVISLDVSANSTPGVPEPATWGLVGLAIAGAGLLQTRRKGSPEIWRR